MKKDVPEICSFKVTFYIWFKSNVAIISFYVLFFLIVFVYANSSANAWAVNIYCCKKNDIMFLHIDKLGFQVGRHTHKNKKIY